MKPDCRPRRVRIRDASVLFALGLFVSSFLAAAQPLPPGVTAGPAVEGISEYTLANGLRVLLFPDASKPTVTVNTTYLVGSRHESYGETGMAHLLEHLVFKGTPTSGNLMQEFGKRGMSFNGTTWYDRTNYFETFSASEANLDWALAMDADRMVNSRIAKSDLDSEMSVVRNEMERNENAPSTVLYQRMLSVAFQWHNYGKATIGARSDVENVDIGRLQRFYRLYYQPDNAILVVAGNFDPQKTLAAIVRHYGSIPKPERVLPKLYTVDAPQEGERQVVLRRVASEQWVGATYHGPAATNADYPLLSLVLQVFADSPTGRLHKRLVETNKAASVVGMGPGLHDPGFLLFLAQVREGGSLQAAQDALLSTFDEIAKVQITAEELERSRVRMLKNIELAMNDPQRLGVALSENIAAGDWRLYFFNRDAIANATLADVQRVAQTWLKPSNRTLGLFIPDASPQRAPAGEPRDALALLKDYQGRAAIDPGEVFVPTPENVDARSRHATLSNGMKVTLLPVRTRGGAVAVALDLHLGDEASLMNERPAGAVAAQMLLRGSTVHNREQLQDLLNAGRSSLSISGSETGISAHAESLRQNLPALLDLLAEVMRKPAFPASEFDQLRNQWLSSFESQRTSPDDIGQKAVARHYNRYPPGHAYYVSTLDEEVAKISGLELDAVKRFYAEFAGGSNAELAIAGDIDVEPTLRQLEALFGDWKSAKPYARIATPYLPPKPVQLSFTTPDKANAYLYARMYLPVKEDSADYAALVVANFILGGSSNSRLVDRIRQKEGISYGVRSSFSSNPFEENSEFGIFAIYAPQNLPTLQRSMLEELERLRRDGITETELADAKQGLRQQRQLARSQYPVLASTLARNDRLGRSFVWYAALDRATAALTIGEVNAAIRKYLDPANLANVYAGDFNKKAPVN